MIIQWAVSALKTFLVTIITALPAPSVPSWLSSISTNISDFTSGWSNMGVWFPGSIFTSVLTAWALAYAISVTIRITRMGASFISGGGGSVA